MNPDKKKPTLLIAEIQYLIIEGLKSLLSDRFIFKGSADSKQSLLNALEVIKPDFLIMDFLLFDFKDFDELKDLKNNHPATTIVILTNSVTRKDLLEFKQIGIRNIIHKNADFDQLNDCLNAAVLGKKFYSDFIMDIMFENSNNKFETEDQLQLTPTETEIVKMIAEGLTTKEIAIKKYISFHTVMTHRKNILRKLNVSNASELIMHAVKSGIINIIDYQI
jgi:DNA-binding NarL/FixJ family response regulator